MKNCFFLVFILITFFSFVSCEKKYQRPRKYEIDLFANEKNDSILPYIMPEDEAYGISDMVIASSEVVIRDSLKGRGKPVYIYSVQSGNLLFSKRDSVIAYPFHFLSGQKLDFKKNNKDSVYVYLEKLTGYKSVADMTNIKYQWLRGAPIYVFDKERK